MRKTMLIIILIGLSLSINAQNTFPSSGNVGIGILNPQWGKLQINSSSDTENALRLEIGKFSMGGAAEFQIDKPGTHGGRLIVKENGNIGIGSTNPTANFEVYKYDVLSHARIFTNQHTGMAKLEIAGGAAGFGGFYSGWSIYHSYSQTNKDLYFRHGQSGEPSVIFADNGNVAIYGKLESKEVKVTLTPTADFVFEENYNLPTLDFIDKHVKEKKHLPEIASAKEMKENGVNIGKFQIQLLQKIEELTLYTIIQEKKIKSLEKQKIRIEKLERENEQLTVLNEKLLELQKKIEKLEKK